MKNIIDYALEFNKSFEEEPFNEVDGLVLSQLCYLNLDGYSDKLSTHNYSIFDLDNDRSDTLLKIRVPRQNNRLLKALANNPRFKNIKIIAYENIRNPKQQKQFSATIYSLNNICFVAFRGTDSTVVGWKEDFNAMYMDIVPSQQESVDFIIRNRNLLDKFYIGGHSKGGNMAVYSAVNLPKELQDNIITVFDNDGPGVRKEILDTEAYLNVKDRIIHILPEQSVFGLILFSENYQIVKSDGLWIQQHDPFNWHILNNCFVYLEKITSHSSINRDALNRWLYESEPEKRELLVDTIYQLVAITNAEKIGDIPVGIIKNYDTIIKTIKQLNKDDLTKISEVLAEYKNIRKEIDESTTTINEHKVNKDVKKYFDKVTIPIKKFIEKLPIEEYLDILSSNTIVKKTKTVAKSIGKTVTATTKKVVVVANDTTKQISEGITKELAKIIRKKTIYTGKVNKERFVSTNKVKVAKKAKKVKPPKKASNKKLAETQKFKEKYFDYYDDVKHYSKGQEDW